MSPAEEPGVPALDLAFAVDPGLSASPGGQCQELVSATAGEARWRELLRRWLAALAPELPGRLRSSGYSLGLRITDDEGIAALNGRWRAIAAATDVLAFAAQEDGSAAWPQADSGHSAEPLELGDVVISLPTAARQAEEAGHGLERELLFLASHGLLHLLGWDHPDDASLAAMLERQERLMGEG
jgi:probable rRNA maturation factor